MPRNLRRLIIASVLVVVCIASALYGSAAASRTGPAHALDRPNIILVNMDNFGYGELGVYGGGITRGGATPRIDSLAAEGLRLTNFNVEAQCTPSRAALMTGRYAKRSGNASVPFFTAEYGLTQWEITLAEALSAVGYATGIFGKWHLGHTPGRYPTDQGFDEWYGIPNSSDESLWPGTAAFEAARGAQVNPFVAPEYVYRGRKGETPVRIKRYDADARRAIDRDITDHTKSFIARQVEADKPFFAYVPYTMTHFPVQPSAEYEGRSGNGKWGDVLMQIDAYVGELLDTAHQLGIADDTLFIFTSDNGPEMLAGEHGWSGPWRGSYFTAREGSLRVPFILRWPKKVPAGRVSNEIVHQMDLFPTLVRLAGGSVPTDRVIDGLDQSDFFLGRSRESARESFVIYVGEEIFGVKWQNWKMLTREFDDGTGLGAIKNYGVPRFYNLYDDPRELHPWTAERGGQLWVRWPIMAVLTEHLQSLKDEPPILPGTPDP